MCTAYIPENIGAECAYYF